MELSRRDVLAALAAAGATTGAGCLADVPALDDVPGVDDAPVLDAHDRDTLVALADVLYPSEVTGIPSFVETYSVGRVTDRPDYARGMHETVATLDAHARDWFDDAFASLPPGDRDALLDQMMVDTADPVPDGSPPQRVRFYLVNDLLYALYTTPTGAGLAGLENPPGHPGGTTSYQRGPRDP